MINMEKICLLVFIGVTEVTVFIDLLLLSPSPQTPVILGVIDSLDIEGNHQVLLLSLRNQF